jgi:hypothetical protein
MPAWAADWVLVVDDETRAFHVDRSSITQSANYKVAWSRITYIELSSDVERSAALAEYDCTGRRLRFLQHNIYYRDGSNTVEAGDDVWRYVAPDTAIQGIFDLVCFGRLPQ